MEFLSTISNDAQIQFFGEHEEFPSLMDTVETLRSAETVARGYRDKQSINGSKVVFGDYNNDGDTTVSSPATFTNNNIHHSAFSDVSSTNMHRRRVSSPPNLYTGSLSIDDPVEEDENDGGLWYYGGNTGSAASVVGSNGTVKSGRRSPSPPRVQSAEDSSCGTAHNKTVSTINSSSISSSSNSSNNCNGNRKSRTHRRNFSTGGIGLSNSSASFSTKHENNYCPSRSAKDSSLFRLIVTLQLCLVRIEEVNSVLCKGRAVGDGDQSRGLDERDGQGGRSRSSCRLRPDLKSCSSIDSELSVILPRRAVTNNQKLFTQPYSSYWKKSQIFAISSIGIGATFYFATRSKSTIGNAERIKLLKTTGKVAAGALAASFIRKRWRILCMNARVTNTSAAIEDWIFHWICLAHDSKSDYGHKQSRKVSTCKHCYLLSFGLVGHYYLLSLFISQYAITHA